METTKLCKCCRGSKRSYPTYEEWKPFPILQEKYPSLQVLILPMRNGNNIIFSPSGLTIVMVLILPMRNGNYKSIIIPDFSYGAMFLSYLWGMETDRPSIKKNKEEECSYPTYEEWKPLSVCFIILCNLSVLILPMRNGNSHPFLLDIPTPRRFLSYLWGMETSKCRPYSYRTHRSSYPTYEEWKLLTVLFLLSTLL